MAKVELPFLRRQYDGKVCEVCGMPSGELICESCRIRIRAEALSLKKRKDKGEA